MWQCLCFYLAEEEMSNELMKKLPSDIRVNNISAIFNLLFPTIQMPRVELGNKIGLSRMATSEVTGEMIRDHILREVGDDMREGRGKRSKVLAIDTSYWRVIVLDLSDSYAFKGAIMDLCGSIIKRIEVSSGNTDEEKVNKIIELCHNLASATERNILGIGVALAGIVNKDGTVVRSVRLNLTDFPIKKIIEDATGIPTIVSHDTSVSLVAERFFGRATENSMLITVSGGVGASLYINDKIVSGSTFSAGEIGHIIVNPDGDICNCGRRGCLESMLSEPILRNRIAENPENRDKILHDAGCTLGRIMSVPVGLLNLHDVAIYGASDIICQSFLDGMREEFHNNISNGYCEPPEVYRCSQGEDLVLRGQGVEVIRKMVPIIHRGIA